MALPYIVQSYTSGVPTPGNLNPITMTGVTAGNLLICGMFSGGGAGGTLTCTDSQGNNWATKSTVNLATDSDTITVLATIASATGNCVVTFYVNAVTPSGGLRAVLYEAANSTTTLDGGAGATSNTTGATTLDSGPLITGAHNGLLFSIGATDNATNATIGPLRGWTNPQNFGDTSDPNPIGLAQVSIAPYPGTYEAKSTTLASAEQATILVCFLSGGRTYMIAK